MANSLPHPSWPHRTSPPELGQLSSPPELAPPEYPVPELALPDLAVFELSGTFLHKRSHALFLVLHGKAREDQVPF
ncbi:hypothetical protein GCM10025779_05710 [Arthrobacter cryoconiti]